MSPGEKTFKYLLEHIQCIITECPVASNTYLV